jgi:hypothetical protein
MLLLCNVEWTPLTHRATLEQIVRFMPFTQKS